MGNARAVQTLPAFVNQWAGSAGRSLEVLRSDPRVEVRTPSPEEFPDAVAEEIRKGARRIVVAGGDGTLTTAAKGLTDTPASLCIVPSGTLNHIARRLGIPEDPRRALETAFSGTERRVDGGRVNGRLFLNTCIFGLYVDVVRRRDRLKRSSGRHGASIASAAYTLATYDDLDVDFDGDDVHRSVTTPFVYTAVGERDLEATLLSRLKDGGRRGLHIVIPEAAGRLRPSQRRWAGKLAARLASGQPGRRRWKSCIRPSTPRCVY